MPVMSKHCLKRCWNVWDQNQRQIKWLTISLFGMKMFTMSTTASTRSRVLIHKWNFAERWIERSPRNPFESACLSTNSWQNRSIIVWRRSRTTSRHKQFINIKKLVLAWLKLVQVLQSLIERRKHVCFNSDSGLIDYSWFTRNKTFSRMICSY